MDQGIDARGQTGHDGAIGTAGSYNRLGSAAGACRLPFTVSSGANPPEGRTMPVVTCQCGQSLNAPAAGGRFKCPKCKESLAVPAEIQKQVQQREPASRLDIPTHASFACENFAILTGLGTCIGAIAVGHTTGSGIGVFITIVAGIGSVFTLLITSSIIKILAGIHNLLADLVDRD